MAKAAREAGGVFPVESKTLLKHLADAGHIATAVEKGYVRRTPRVRIGSGNPRVMKLRCGALDDLFPVITGNNSAPGTLP